MANYDWTKFTRRITIDASIGQIYELWSRQEGLERWFLRQAVFTDLDKKQKPANAFIGQGDTYRWLWFGYPDTVFEEGIILDANGNNMVQFTFAKHCVVTVRIVSELGQNICELVQSQIPDNEQSKISLHIGCLTGWTFYLSNLKSVLEGNIDLRNKNEDIPGVLNA